MQSQTGVKEGAVSTPRAPSTVCAKLASSCPQKVGSVWVRLPAGSGQGSAPCLPTSAPAWSSAPWDQELQLPRSKALSTDYSSNG